ncbi:uncharacterized protein LOC113855705 [Abrus precatorius]|uniref:Uncharacterized protein LOC113855705 n=1 Tax=Abrus precatorius TaxID=3816 RepID=A0A8B8KH46_ABRPR|nr:uncharacterized protein LOC113855705 [Abrus precatorius]
MPVSDPTSGRTFIWIIAGLLFVSLMTGGACLVAYMVLPESETTSWIPTLGVTLVCLPWVFWLLTFIYRIFSRCFGCRFSIGGGAGAGAGNCAVNADVEVPPHAKGGGLNRASSVASHESEMALTKSMA